MSDGFVYFIQEEETDCIMIGFSEKLPKGRLKDFQIGNSNKLILLGYIEGTFQDESNLHLEFSEERIRDENEWFECSPRLANKIKELLENFYEDKKSEVENLNIHKIDINEDDKKHKEYIPSLIYSKSNSNPVTFREPDGERYVGEFKEGKENGKGTYTFSNGEIYVGEFKDGLPNGKGTYINTNGGKYVGEFKDGNAYGQGTYISTNGGIYVGEFKHGVPDGQGTLKYPDGKNYMGEFKDDKIWTGIFHTKYGIITEKIMNGKSIKQ